MITVRQTEIFSDWLDGLRDGRARAAIAARIRRVQLGNFGDVEPISDGISELRIHYGPGYRVYFVKAGSEIILLLCGGDKSTQRRDIELARKIKMEIGA
jgi:putative addiction module killer protein